MKAFHLQWMLEPVWRLHFCVSVVFVMLGRLNVGEKNKNNWKDFTRVVSQARPCSTFSKCYIDFNSAPDNRKFNYLSFGFQDYLPAKNWGGAVPLFCSLLILRARGTVLTIRWKNLWEAKSLSWETAVTTLTWFFAVWCVEHWTFP